MYVRARREIVRLTRSAILRSHACRLLIMENGFIYLSINDGYVFRRMIDKRLLKRETSRRDSHVDDRVWNLNSTLFWPPHRASETRRHNNFPSMKE